MLNCKEVAARAGALVDGELSLWDALQMRLHLAFCRGCRHFIDQIRTTDRLTATIAQVDLGMPDDADDGRLAEVLSMLREQKPQDRRGGRERKDLP